MIFNLNIPEDRVKFRAKVDYLVNSGKIAELTEKKQNRTTRQNSALHLFFELLARALNENGFYFIYKGLYKNEVEIEWDKNMVKEYIWRPFQKYKLGIESTTELKTNEIDKVLEIIFQYYGEKGIVLEFPSRIQDYMDSLNY